jgi:adenylyltransferase/sulfurtransferase
VDDDALLRYSRHILLPQLGYAGQARLREASVLIIGAGGLGSASALYLAAAGIGQLYLADFDVVELSNLQRQILHDTASIGLPKVTSAQQRLAALNPKCRVTPIHAQLTAESLLPWVAQADVILDGSDNFATRFAVNAACVQARKPLVSGAALGWQGQLSVFLNQQPEDACYACLYPVVGNDTQTCSANGVIAPLVGVIGAMQAVEALKLLTGAGAVARNRLLVYDALTADWRSFSFRRDPACPVCGGLG